LKVENVNQKRVPFAFAKKHGVVLMDSTAYYKQPLSQLIIQEVSRFVRECLSFEKIGAQKFDLLLSNAYALDSTLAKQEVERFTDDINLADLIESIPDNEDLLEQQDDAPVIRLLNALLSEAIKRGSSDVHLETFEECLLIRFRVDGVLHEVQRLKKMLAPILVSRIKVMSKLDIAEKRTPQDGRISLRIGGRAVDVRVSVMPTHFGERIVMRLLDKGSVKLALSNLGMSEKLCQKISALIRKPHGILLVTGPTGSGKSTTLYAGLTELNQTARNILTIEDPIEYYLAGVGQTQVNTKVGMTFGKGLRAILRQDPDVVMLGEIRDIETAKIAVQASLTGHLVLSTLHTNSAVGAITRLSDMGIEPFLLSSSLIGVLAQRLVRLLCNECKRVANVSSNQLLALGLDASINIYEPVGCEDCHSTGYTKRIGIYHLIEVDERLQALIHQDASEAEIKKICETDSLRQAGVECVANGLTSIEEIQRVTSEV